jgi:hypothetical protein
MPWGSASVASHTGSRSRGPCGVPEAPRYLIRDRDCVYGAAVTHRLRTMGIDRND